MQPLLLALALAAGAPVTAGPPTDLRGEPLMAALKGGGYTIVLRHARTDRTFQEAMGYVPTSRTQQRNLNDDGVRDARLMGVVFKKYEIPFSDIVASPMYRTMETAEYAVGPATPTMVLRTFPTTEEQKQLIAVVPRPGTNRLLVTHHFVIETWVPGIRPGDIAESEAAVVRTAADGSIELVGKILLADWAALAGSAAPTSAAPSPPRGHGAPPATSAPGPTGPVSWPDTPAARLAHAYVGAFNSGDTTQMRRFIESYLTIDSSRPVADRLASYSKLFAEHGPLQVTGVENVSPQEFRLSAQARRATVRITVKESGQQPGRAASITLAFEGGQE
ncbi:MAG TPA: histidine phosphatase family protein [Gemmatimonadales bacterium]|nr:histidine phosphatase family protein [Gemmatimonadales bacterium]